MVDFPASHVTSRGCILQESCWKKWNCLPPKGSIFDIFVYIYLRAKFLIQRPSTIQKCILRHGSKRFCYCCYDYDVSIYDHHHHHHHQNNNNNNHHHHHQQQQQQHQIKPHHRSPHYTTWKQTFCCTCTNPSQPHHSSLQHSWLANSASGTIDRQHLGCPKLPLAGNLRETNG